MHTEVLRARAIYTVIPLILKPRDEILDAQIVFASVMRFCAVIPGISGFARAQGSEILGAHRGFASTCKLHSDSRDFETRGAKYSMHNVFSRALCAFVQYFLGFRETHGAKKPERDRSRVTILISAQNLCDRKCCNS